MVTRSSIAKMVLAAVAVLTIPAAGAAQDRGRVPGPGRVIEIPCCTCVDGSTKTVSLSTGAVPWAVSGPGVSGTPAVGVSHSAWAPVSGASWVGPSAGASSDAPKGTYTYRVRFRVPDCVIGGKVIVTGRFAADNSAVVSVDGSPTLATSQGTPDYGFQAGSITNFSSGPIAPGFHYLEVRVSNIGGATGVAVQANVKVQCPKELEIRR